jgi:Helix-turn-helix of DDE superfamily endonuclease
LSTCVIAAETLTHRDSHGGWLVAQSWNVQWAATTAIALRSVRLLLVGVLCLVRPELHGVSALCMAKPLVNEAIDQDPHHCQGASVLFYPAALPLSSQTLTYTAGIIRRYRAQIGSPWRKLNAGRQALLALACLRKGETFVGLAAGFGVGTATAWRYVTETVGLPGPRGCAGRWRRRTRTGSCRRSDNSRRARSATAR